MMSLSVPLVKCQLFICYTLQQPDLSDIILPPLEKRFVGYYKIARHYGWALNQVFNTLNYSSVIVVEGMYVVYTSGTGDASVPTTVLILSLIFR